MRYLVQSQENNIAKNGNPFLKMQLINKEEQITAYYWSSVKYDYTDKVVLIEAKRSTLAGSPILTIDSIIIDQDQSKTDIMPTTSFDIPGLIARWGRLAGSVQTPEYKALLTFIQSSVDLWNKYITKPAATGHHHAFVGGLLTHSVGVAETANAIAKNYPYLDRDLIITGALLHDIGKTQTYTDDLNITEQYPLMEHIVIGQNMVRDMYRQVNQKSDEKLDLLCHVILSHHNKQEWGSPVQPCIPEAFIVSYSDYIDAYMAQCADVDFTQQIAKTKGGMLPYSMISHSIIPKEYFE